MGLFTQYFYSIFLLNIFTQYFYSILFTQYFLLNTTLLITFHKHIGIRAVSKFVVIKNFPA
jgi:hypothetical protein